ncbi:condensation domain-containing protein, partial [Nocardia cyriacigeorgica]
AVDNVPFAVRLTGALDVSALERAVADIFARHEVLRTVYPTVDGEPVQVVLPAGQATPSLRPVEITESELIATVIDFVLTTFDVTAEVPLKVALFRIADSA